MEAIQRSITLYHTGFLICLICCGIFLVCSIIMFIRFNIPKIISDKTGRALKKSMKAVEAKNARTSALRSGSPSGNMSAVRPQPSQAAPQWPTDSGGSPVSRITPPPATDVLVPGTDVLASSGMAENMRAKTEKASSEPVGSGSDSASLVPDRDDLPIKFHITKRVILIHTDEAIES